MSMGIGSASARNAAPPARSTTTGSPSPTRSGSSRTSSPPPRRSGDESPGEQAHERQPWRAPAVRDVLIVGSVPLGGAEAVFRALAGALGARVRRLPDGETGARLNWIEFQTPVFDSHPMFEPAPEDEGAKADWRNAAANA